MRLAEAQPEAEEWPEDPSRYLGADACHRTSLLEPWQRFREFTIGAGCFHSPKYLDPEVVAFACPRLLNVRCGRSFEALFKDAPGTPAGPDPGSITFHTKVLLLTELIDEIVVYFAELTRAGDEGKLCIQGITFLKGDSILDTGCLNAEHRLSLRLDPKAPFLRRIALQQTIWRVAGTRILRKRITYLKLEPPHGPPLLYGRLHDPGLSKTGEWVCPVEREEGTLAIVGVGYSHALPLSFQLIDCAAAKDPLDHLATMCLGRSVLSCVNVFHHLDLYEHCRLPALEDAEGVDLLEALLAGIDNASPSDAELLPNAIKFVDKTQAGDVACMMSIFRIDRYLTYILYKREQVGMWDVRQNHWRKLLSLKQMLAILSSITLFSRKLQLYKPLFNVYTYAVLTETAWDTSKAYLTFGTQFLLMVLCVYGMDMSNFGEDYIHLAIATCVTAIVIFMVYEQVANHFAIAKTFSHAEGCLLMWIDSIANVLIPILVIALNFALLASSEAHLDMVTNATAVLCILEMDSAMLAADEDQIKARLCAFAYRYLQDTIRAKEPRYWIHAGVLKDRPHINVEHCALVWPPDAAFPHRPPRSRNPKTRRPPAAPTTPALPCAATP